MCEKYTYEELVNKLKQNEERYKIILISKTSLICTTNGEIYRKMKSGNWKEIKNEIVT